MLSVMKESDDTENRTDGKLSFPSAVQQHGRHPAGFSRPSSGGEKAVIHTEFCTLILHNPYTAKFAAFRSNRINYSESFLTRSE